MMNAHNENFNFKKETINAPIVGKEYLFHIMSEEADEHGKVFFNVFSREIGKQRFYFKNSHPLSPGEYIRLTVSEITPRGAVILSDSELAISEQEISMLPQVEEMRFDRESEILEYKSSLCHTNKGFCDIDKQLGFEIIMQIAGFMNTNGGTVMVGYRNDGRVCGINRDIPYINNSKVDKFVYKANMDSIELKVRNTIIDRLGLNAVGLVDISFFRTGSNLLVMHISVKPAHTPVYYLNKFIYVRSGNSTLALCGEAITQFVVDRILKFNNTLQGNNNSFINVTAAAGMKAEAEIQANAAVDVAVDDEVKYLNIFKNGEAAASLEESCDDETLYSIPFTREEIADSDERIILCYSNGHIAVFTPNCIFSQKLCKMNKRYMNGFNQKAVLTGIVRCRKDDFLLIRSKLHMDGSEFIKAVSVSKYNPLEGTSLHAIGNKVVDKKFAVCKEFKAIAAGNADNIAPVLCKTGYTAGYSVAAKGKTVAEWLAA